MTDLSRSNSISPSPFDESHLLSLAIKKWQIILTTTVIFTILGVGYVFLSEKNWISRAKITTALPYELRDLIKLSGILPSDRKDLNITEKLFKDFETTLSSQNTKITFLRDSELFKSQKFENDGEKNKWLDSASTHQITIEKDRDNRVLTVEFHATTPEDANKYLSQLLETANSLTINSSLDSAIALLSEAKDSVQRKLDLEYDHEVTMLEQALETARLAGLKEYKGGGSFNQVGTKDSTGDASNNDTYYEKDLFLLGENNLKAKLNILKRGKKYTSTHYRKLSNELDLLIKMKNKGSSGKVYRYLADPSYPSEKELSRGGRVIVVLSVFLGLFIGTAVAFFVNHFES